jgi:hypothetical protein
MREDSPKVSEGDENTPQIGDYIYILFVSIRYNTRTVSALVVTYKFCCDDLWDAKNIV